MIGPSRISEFVSTLLYCAALLYVTGPEKIDHMSTNKIPFLSLLYYNLLPTNINATKSLQLLQNLMGFLLQFKKSGYYIQN